MAEIRRNPMSFAVMRPPAAGPAVFSLMGQANDGTIATYLYGFVFAKDGWPTMTAPEGGARFHAAWSASGGPGESHADGLLLDVPDGGFAVEVDSGSEDPPDWVRHALSEAYLIAQQSLAPGGEFSDLYAWPDGVGGER